MKTRNQYFLSVGEKGSHRLDILNELFYERSTSFILRTNPKPGNRVLEIGCGTGSMTSWLSEQVGPTGRIYALDNNPEQLEIAKKKAIQKQLTNVTFIESDLENLYNLDIEPVDIIYGRFVLVYVRNPFKILEEMLGHLKRDGYVICEEACNSVTYCYPFSPVIQKSRQLFFDLAKKKGFDFELGDKLYSYFYQLNLKNITTQFVQPIYKTMREKLLIPLTFEEAAKSYVENSLIAKEEIKPLLCELYKFVENEHYCLSFPRTTQIYAQKSG